MPLVSAFPRGGNIVSMKATSVFWQPALQVPGETVRGLDDIRQAIQIILRTSCGNDPYRPELGNNLHLYIDQSVDRAIPHVVCESVDAIRRWEPHYQFMSVKFAADGEHLISRVSWKGSDGQTRTQELLWR